MPVTPLLGRNQPSIALLMLLVLANCIVSSSGAHHQSQFADLNLQDDHGLLTSENKESAIQELTVAQLNAWNVVSHFAECSGKLPVKPF